MDAAGNHRRDLSEMKRRLTANSMHIPAILEYATKVEVVDPDLRKIATSNKRQMSEEQLQDAWASLQAAAAKGSILAACESISFVRNGWVRELAKDQALALAERLAQRGIRPGYFLLAQFHEAGEATPIDLDLALHMYKKGATGPGSFGPAATYVASMYERLGNGSKALHYAFRGHLLGDPMASLLVASWYEQGSIVKLNYGSAVAWYCESSSMGNYFATERLIRAYSKGELGLEPSTSKAEQYASLFDAQVLSKEEGSS